MVTQCCVCKRILDKEKKVWVNPGNVDMSKVTHTYCPTCMENTRRLLGLKPRTGELSSVPAK